MVIIAIKIFCIYHTDLRRPEDTNLGPVGTGLYRFYNGALMEYAPVFDSTFGTEQDWTDTYRYGPVQDWSLSEHVRGLSVPTEFAER